ncbi:hypothetical protein ACH5AO_25195 [Streptomyces sp. NPDC018964]|uniref:hypothetical protein n=1 Tax=Streptomyces sp. NPDC018964 TaxID=3365058 RepID=UPI0037A8BC02
MAHGVTGIVARGDTGGPAARFASTDFSERRRTPPLVAVNAFGQALGSQRRPSAHGS